MDSQKIEGSTQSAYYVARRAHADYQNYATGQSESGFSQYAGYRLEIMSPAG